MAQIINGKEIATNLRNQLKEEIAQLKKKYGSEQEEETNFKKKGKVFLKKFISNYSTVLKKDFNKT